MMDFQKFCVFLHRIIRYNYENEPYKRCSGGKGISQTWLAKKLDKSFNTVNSYVCNRSQPNLETLLRISDILDVEMKDLIVEKEQITED